MSSLNLQTDWNFRVQDKRLIIVKTKNESVHKSAVLDVLTGLTFAVEAQAALMPRLAVGKQYLASLKIYTSKNMEGIDKEFIGFFEALDVDQSLDDFVKAYWVYPGKIRFELIEIEEP